MTSLIIITPGAINIRNFSWENKTIKHDVAEKEGNQMECSLRNCALYSIYHLNTMKTSMEA